MPAPTPGRAARSLRRSCAGLLTVAVAVVTDATPAAAHNVGGGTLPAPPWLLSYVGAFVVAATAVALRASWSGTRLRGFVGPEAMVHGAPPSARPVPSPVRAPIGLHVGHLLGLLALVLVGAAAVVGPDSGAANIAPVAVLVVWWVGLPIAAWLGGDVMRAINPFVAIVALLDRGGERSVDRAPAWTSAAFLAAFAWFFVAYHRPGSPRALAVFLAVYLAAAVAGGLRWGRAWLATGEGFGGLSASVALLSPRRRNTSVPPGVGALMIVWLGSTLFDAFSSTPFWVDVLGTSQGWTRTLLNSVGLVWLTAIVAGVYLLALRLAERDRRADSDGPSLAVPLGVALIPLALGVFLAHDVTLLLFEGQNFIALLSDPLGRGWDLFGTINRTIDYRLVQAGWVPWLQLGVLVAAHVAAVVIAHDTALALVPRRTAMRFTWALAGVATVSIVAGALMVLG